MTQQSARRESMELLAESVRRLADSVAETALDPAIVQEITTTIDGLTAQLRALTDDRPYSGLVETPDYTIPEGPMPLNPIIGACSPTRPDVRLRFADGEVRGSASF